MGFPYKSRAVLPGLIPLLLLAGLPGSGLAQRAHSQLERPPRIRFLTPPSQGDPLTRLLTHMRERRAVSGLEPEDLDDWSLRDRYVTRHNRATHLVLRQRYRGIEVFDADVRVTIASDGRMIGLGNRFLRGLGRAIHTTQPRLSALEAVERAAAKLGLPLDEPLQRLAGPSGPARATRLSQGGISLDEIPVKLMYLPQEPEGVRLVWNLVLRTRDQKHWWNIHVDTATGELLWQNDWIAHDSYRVFALPQQNPTEGPRTLEVDPADLNASPFGWHDTDGVPGAESNDTSGNNVTAQEDSDGNNSGGFLPDGGPQRIFNLPLDLSLHPSAYQSAAITNLFYWNNVLHDIFYRYGFDEAGGNFQENNYGNGGAGSDPVFADAQDGSSSNNASFGTPPDGSSPRMQMFLWSPGAIVTVHSPASSAGDYAAGGTQFGFGPVLTQAGLRSDVVRALDPENAAGPSPTDACSVITNATELSGKIALIDRGECLFVNKVLNAQDAGAIAVIIVNNAGDGVFRMCCSNPSIEIPSVLIGQSDGDRIKQGLASGFPVNATLSEQTRDSDLDNSLIIHEYGHGVSNRLTGGKSNADCLSAIHSEGMGEGWGDWWALALTALPGENGTDPRAIAAYANGSSDLGPGIRNFPYSTDLDINPLTFVNIADSTEEHDVGEIWSVVLWELFWILADHQGLDTDLYAGTGGNNVALRLVMDALKVQPCNPTFLEGRNAILSADLLSYEGRNRCLIWAAFAKRGMGENAEEAGGPDNVSVTEGFEIPSECRICGDVNGDGRVDLLDTTILRRALAGRGPGMDSPERCNVAGATNAADGDGDGLLDDCDGIDLAALREQLAGLDPGTSPVCAPAVSPVP